MKATGRTLYLSGQVTDADIVAPANPGARGLVPIWQNERQGYGYVVRFVGAFPGPFPANRYNRDYLLTTYGERDLRTMALTVPGQNMALRIIGAQQGMPPASNDRVIASYSGDSEKDDRYDSGIIKHDALVVQALSLGVEIVEGKFVTYYIEMEEFELSDDERVLALLSESAQNVANLTVE